MAGILDTHRRLTRFGAVALMAALAIVVLGGVLGGRAKAAPTATFVKNVGVGMSKTDDGEPLRVTVPAGGVAAGHSLIVTVAMDDAEGEIIASDPAGNFYNLDVQRSASTGTSPFRTAILSAHNVAALQGGDVISISFPAVRGKVASVAEFAGLAASNALDKTAGASGNGASPDSTPITTTQADELLIGAIGVEGPAEDSFSAGTTGLPALLPYTMMNRTGTTGSAAESNVTINSQYRIVAVTGAYTSGGTLLPTRPWTALIASYKVDVSAPAPTIGLSPSSPSNNVNTSTPSFGGSAGSLNSDNVDLSLKIFQGGTEIRSLSPTRTGGTWGPTPVTPALPSDGTYSAQITQADQATNNGTASITFTVDTAKPTSSANALPAYNQNTFTVNYSTGDGSGTGVKEVELWVKRPGDATFNHAQTDGSPATPNFTYTAAAGDGTYEFFTRALDNANNYENAAAGAQASTLVDTLKPGSFAAPDPVGYSNTTSLTVPFNMADAGSDVASVDLYVKRPGDAGFGLALTRTTSPFTYTAAAGDGTYEFYTRARDNASNYEDAPPTRDRATVVDTAAPVSAAAALPAKSPATQTITYSASDATAGIDRVQLWVKKPGGAFELAITDPDPSTPVFSYTATVNGTHEFYTVAIDRAANAEAPPSLGLVDASSSFDIDPPTSSANALPSYSASTITVGYAAGDVGPAGVKEVELWVKGPDTDSFQLAATDTSPASPSFSYGAPSEGAYAVYTRARDDVSNYESAPEAADTTTIVDATKPTSAAGDIADYSTSTTLTIPYAASDGTSGVGQVELWVKAPGDAAFSLASTTTASPFTYTAAAGNGTYEFYTRAKDNALNHEDAPAVSDTDTILDTTRPSSAVAALPPESPATQTISYSSSDATAGVASVQLWVKQPGGSFALEGTDLTPSTPQFTFTTTVSGMHEFYTIAVDRAGNQELPPSLGLSDASSTFDVEAPSSSANALPGMSSQNITVNYTAADNGPAGVASVELWAKGPSDAAYSLVATDTNPITPQFTYTAGADGLYRFYTRSHDDVGNYEGAPLGGDGSVTADTSTTVETQAPVSALDPAPAYNNTRTLNLTYTASDIGSGLASVELWVKEPGDVSYSLADTDGTPNNTRLFSYPTGADGVFHFYTRATDNVGTYEVAPESADVSVRVDTVRPTSAVQSLDEYTVTETIDIDYTATDPAAGIDTVQLWVRAPGAVGFDLAAVSTDPTATSFEYQAEAGPGTYEFYTRAIDKAGNHELAPAIADAETFVDPDVPTSVATSPATSNGGPIHVSYEAADAIGGSGVLEVEIYVKGPDDDAFSLAGVDDPSVPAGMPQIFEYTADQGDGDYAFYTRARDAADNLEAAPPAPDATTTVDTIDPVTTDDSDGDWHREDFTITLAASDDDSGIARTEYRIDGAAGDPFQIGNAIEIDTDAIGDGIHTLYYRSIDVADNEEPTKSTTFKVDTQDPVTSDDADDGWHRTDFDVTLTATDPGADDDPATGSGVDGTEYRIDGGTFRTGDVASLNVTALGSGTHTIDYRSVDGAGNRETLRSIGVKVDVAAPTTTDDYDGKWHNEDVTIALSSTDPHSGTDTIRYSTDDGTSYTTGNSVTVPVSAGDGEHQVHYYSSDVAGNTETAKLVTVKIDTAPPTSEAVAPATSGPSDIEVDYSTEDARSGVATIELYVKRPGDGDYALTQSETPSDATGSFSYTAEAGTGTYRFYTRAIDAAGNVEDEPGAGAVTTDVDATAPVSSASAPSTATGAFTVTYSASDVGAGLEEVELFAKGPDDEAFELAGTDATPNESPSFEYSPSEGPGTYRFYTVAHDLAGNAETAPGAADAAVDITEAVAPRSAASAPGRTRLGAFRVTYVAADLGDDASGVEAVELWVKGPNDADYSRYGDADADTSTPYFNFVAPAGADGLYAFYTVARDGADNVEFDFDPDAPDATTTVDRVAPGIRDMRVRPNPFRLNRRGARTKISFTMGEASSVTLTIKKGRKVIRRLKTATLSQAGGVARYWNGKKTNGQRVISGRYLLRVVATDLAGNVKRKNFYIRVIR